jgi:hypothetical protein
VISVNYCHANLGKESVNARSLQLLAAMSIGQLKVDWCRLRALIPCSGAISEKTFIAKSTTLGRMCVHPSPGQ